MTYEYETIPKKGKPAKRYEIVQSMKDKPLTHHPETGEPIRRIVSGGRGYMDQVVKIDPFSDAQFREKTGQRKGTMGDLWSRSEEWSKMRAEKLGRSDPLRDKYLADYKKKRRGKTPHTAELKDKQDAAKKHWNEGLKKLGISIGPNW